MQCASAYRTHSTWVHEGPRQHKAQLNVQTLSFSSNSELSGYLFSEMAYLSIRRLLITLAVLAPVLLSLRLGNDKFAASLSDRARILLPGSKEFADASLRWSSANSPTYSLVVQVATEADVQQTVRPCKQTRQERRAEYLPGSICESKTQALSRHIWRPWNHCTGRRRERRYRHSPKPDEQHLHRGPRTGSPH